MLGIIFADVAYHMRGFMKSESSHHTLYGHFFRDNFEAGLGLGGEDAGSLRSRVDVSWFR